MKRLLLAAHVLLAAACSVLAEGEGTGLLRNEVYHKEGREDLTSSRLLPVREILEQQGEPEASLLSSRDNFSELPQVAFLSKPQEPVTAKKEGNGKKRKKGKGKKRDPCLRRYKDFCIHGECRYIKELRRPSCVCQQGYEGERCHALSLPVENPSRSYDHTTVLAVTAVVLSSLCLVIIALLLVLRCHKQGVYDVENEEKVKLGNTVSH
ncbi:proheparin-binding EGF-like growth factor [Eublepharis macularius]|uniref:Proheparin-binding EGF-like growth factor n=1 Tax=Eublepharis macularius TaxID=481883 RepID=A0AA97JNF3_EUBMA|nr:proheparin-binding EGF-like growth factor [Eublepharis macularius]